MIKLTMPSPKRYNNNNYIFKMSTTQKNLKKVDDLIQNIKMRNALGIQTELDGSQIKQIKERDQNNRRYMENDLV